jgi:hypothetical protein
MEFHFQCFEEFSRWQQLFQTEPAGVTLSVKKEVAPEKKLPVT